MFLNLCGAKILSIKESKIATLRGEHFLSYILLGLFILNKHTSIQAVLVLVFDSTVTAQMKSKEKLGKATLTRRP